MPKIDRAIAGCLTVCLILPASGAWAHGAGGLSRSEAVGMSHAGDALAGGGLPRALSTDSSPMRSTAAANPAPASTTAAAARHGTSAPSPLTSPTATTTPPPNLASRCEGEVAANCEAKGEALFSASQGDSAPVWTAPVPTAVPATPAAPAITEPQQTGDTLSLEQSGGASGVVITAGGGPTLDDCMALWAPAVHMTKALWKDVCVRTMNGINEPEVALEHVDPSYKAHRARPVDRQARN